MTSSATLPAGASIRPVSPLLNVLSTAALLLGLTALIFLLHLGSKPEIGFVFATAFLIHLGLSPSRRELMLVLAFAFGFAALYLAAGGTVDHWWVTRVAAVSAALGYGSLAVLGLEAFWSAGETRARARFGIKWASVIPVFGMIAAVAMGFVPNVPATTFDLYLYSFDDRLGFHAAFWGGRLFRQFPWIQQVASLVYDALPLLPALVAAMTWRQRRRLPFDPLVAFVAAAIVCFCLYQVCPGTAPAVAFHDRFPYDPPSSATLVMGRIAVPDAPRNAMPSMHLAWTLLAWWCALSLSRWVRIFSTVFLGWTILATLGLGEHYSCDLMVACAFTLAISAGCAVRLPLRAPPRWQALAFGGVVTMSWLMMLREGILVPVSQPLAWALAIVTVAGSFWLQGRLGAAAIKTADGSGE